MIFTKDEIIKEIPDCEFYNAPDDWTCNGLVIWHTNFRPSDMILIRDDGEKRGVLLKNIKNIYQQAAALVTTGDANSYFKYGKPIIKIKDSHEFLVSMGKLARKKFTGKVIAVTGSCGKTTCVAIINSILSKFGSDTNLSGNTLYGISWNLTTFNTESKYWVVETSLGGRMLKNSSVVIPDYAVVTNIAPVHLEGNQDISFIARRKSEIFSSMKEDSYAILYNEMECFDIVYKAASDKKLNIITFGKNNADAIVHCEENNNYIELFGTKFSLDAPVIPEHILLDMAAAVIIGLFEKIDYSLICESLNSFNFIEGRGNIIEGYIPQNRFITIIDESYNANPVSMEFALRGFQAKFKNNESNVVILGDMAEGGKNSIENHIALEKTLRELNPSRILLCGTIMHNLWEHLKSDFNCYYYENYTDLNNDLLNKLKNNDNIFIKSSNSTKLYKTVKFLSDLIQSYGQNNNILGNVYNNGTILLP